MHIIYLHGFNSGPQSLKAQETASWLQQHAPGLTLHCPQLSPHPAQAIAQAETLLLSLPADTALIGSSLGGYYATVLAEKHGRKAALINPAVQPHQDLLRHLGPQHNPYSGEDYVLGEQDMQALLAMQPTGIRHGQYWLWLGSADEVLDWRLAARRYAGQRQSVFNGDDHRLSRWPAGLPALFSWLRQAD
ncbi:putative esterase [Aquitalea magnusonii]|jgi:hypothetical protein|uniref:Putative esterase n=1 Tax=Aquitalea magnusonii TaxID=332411 RepID=A0A3G9GP55_9NEIS|nr:YqiA/YcfP family alpha/beta fold hydrolase [Aquitalea magnusonii]BBF87442.1 putative esterase [Aquitalea magnusonii]